MASSEEIAELRRKTNLVGDTTVYDDGSLNTLIDSLGSVNMAAAQIWGEKASGLATLVDISESGSSRSMSQAYKNALAMSSYFKGLDSSDTLIENTRVARTRAAVREGE